MNIRLIQWLQEWALSSDVDDSEDVIMDQGMIEYLGHKLFDDYEPAQFTRFVDRLDAWIHNVDKQRDQRTLFLLLRHLFFIGRREFESLCRSAYHGPVCRWVIETLNIDISNASAMKEFEKGVAATWFCPITDSMRINAFFKANTLSGQNHRPDWRSLQRFGNPTKIQQYANDNNLDRLVLLEDFVGSGTQMRKAIRFAVDTLRDVPTLVVPLVVCPKGNEIGEKLAMEYSHLSYQPVLSLRPELFITSDQQAGEPPSYEVVRNLIKQVSHRLSDPGPPPSNRHYHGFKDTGAVVAMYSNCPNNSLPILYDANSSGWQPLFPRIGRL